MHNHEDPVVKPQGECPECDAMRDRWDDAREGILNCDFCGSPIRDKSQMQVVPVEQFQIKSINYANYAHGWGACSECGELVGQDLWLSLLDRAVNITGKDNLRFTLGLIYLGLRSHMTGPIRPWQPSDDENA